MTPGQGVGANTALRDAALLCRRLAAADRGSTTLLEAIAGYEAEMVPYGFARVADSLAQNGTNASDMVHKPVIGRVLLAFNRTALPGGRQDPRSARSSSPTCTPIAVHG